MFIGHVHFLEASRSAFTLLTNSARALMSPICIGRCSFLFSLLVMFCSLFGFYEMRGRGNNNEREKKTPRPHIYIVYETSFTQSTTFFNFFSAWEAAPGTPPWGHFEQLFVSSSQAARDGNSPWRCVQNNCCESSAARPGSPIPRTILRVAPGSQAANPEPEQKKARSRRCEPLSRTIYPRTDNSPRKSPTISHPAGCFLGVIRLFRYLLLYQPHHLMLALRSSSFALPFSETPQAFQALAPYSSR